MFSFAMHQGKTLLECRTHSLHKIPCIRTHLQIALPVAAVLHFFFKLVIVLWANYMLYMLPNFIGL